MLDLARATFDRIAAMSTENAGRNLGSIVRPVTDLSPADPVVVVANGPSLARTQSLQRLNALGYTGAVVAVDGALAACQREGISPTLVVTCDPHPRIAHWFGAEPDDHFRRTRELITHAPTLDGIPLAIATASHPATVTRAIQGGMALYWWNAMLDEPDAGSLTRILWIENGMPCLNGGGNVGTAAWVMAHAILRAKTVVLVGFDFGYPPDLPLLCTQYAPELHAQYGDRWTETLVHYTNGWYADPTMTWFRDIFTAMAKNAPCRTINCTDGGTLDGIECRTLEEWLQSS